MAHQGELVPFAREVVDVPVAEEMSESFLAYSMSVITSRALPDVRDGLKPVQRRILHAMHSMGIRDDTPTRKSARVVGETMGKYHPHGDGAIYDALTRLGQDFGRNVTLVHPQGNFGSLDDPPAAARYTECRLTTAAMDMIGEIGEDTVDFRSTYDGESSEPITLPALLPNLLVNGVSGIAVGMATNMAPHNLGEVHEAIKLAMTKRRPKPTIDELMAVLPGPDFPSGGIVIDDGLRDAYETGRGSIRVRARAEVGQVTARKQGIEITELPYLVGPERVISKIKELMLAGRLNGIADVKNLTDRHHGLRIQIECKTGVNPHAVLTDLYRLTPLEESFGINNVVLVDGEPRTLGLYDLCQAFVDHRLDVVVRRSRFRLGKARDRLHIVEGFLIALDAIDEVVRIIRGSQDTAEARAGLMGRFSLSEIQANAILDMPLRRLTALEKLKLEEERDELVATIADLEAILGSEQRQRTLVLKELGKLVERHGWERRSTVISADQVRDAQPAEPVPLEITDDPCIVTLTTSGLLGREPGEGTPKPSLGRHDVLVASVATTNHQPVFAITDTGRALTVTAMEVPEVAGRNRGAAASEVVDLKHGESVVTITTPGEHPLLLVTRKGVAKRVAPDELAGTKSGQNVIGLKPDDKVVAVLEAADDDEVVIIASDAQTLRTVVDQVSIQGRAAGGVAGMKLKGDATVVGAGLAVPGAMVLSVTDTGTAKLTDVAEIPTKGRATGGVRLTRFKSEKRLAWAHVAPVEDLVAVVGKEDNPTRPDSTPVVLPLSPTRRDTLSTATEERLLAVGTRRF
ncbi:DNA gyrase/topoisomerase IV subunit A [Actinomarinicola tropica]|uniref:DNA topoisomerase (ATP-hydrolyzing) n=1 Tax=Actinomarinicola tropica TaxID=2789776 RepID=A0A5Q2RJX7_9ACTN|nr:DNA topoisomerase IV subunit A [Actinomarinicola tropica]QGG96133.1 DNA topoisomerase 4 subunit A [Actinomarinicola tropica]